MQKEAVKNAREFLTEVPTRDQENLNDYIRRGKAAKSELKALLNQAGIGGKTASSGQDYLEADGLIKEIDEKTSAGELILQRVRFETPQVEEVTAAGDEADVDWQSTINRLAVLTASETANIPEWERYYVADRSYREHIEPKVSGLGDDIEAEMRSRYDSKVDEMLNLNNRQLKQAVEKEFPTEDWIGPDSAPLPDGADHIPSDYEVNDDEADAPNEGSDSNFEKMLDDERRHRGINKASKKASRKKGRYIKIADEIDGIEEEGVDDLLGDVQPLHSVEENEGNKTYWIEHGGELVGFDEADVTELQVVPEEKTDTKQDFGDAANGGSDSSSSDSSSSDSGDSSSDSDSSSSDSDNPFEEKESKRKRAVEDRSDVKQVGEGEGDPKHPEETLEEKFEDSPAGGAPRGPNRRKSEDVPSYSTPSGQLTSPQKASKLAAATNLTNYGFDEDTAYKVASLIFGENEKDAVKKLHTYYTVSDKDAKKIARMVVGEGVFEESIEPNRSGRPALDGGGEDVASQPSGPGYCPNCGGTNVNMKSNESLRQWSQQGGGSTSSTCKDCGEMWTTYGKDPEAAGGSRHRGY